MKKTYAPRFTKFTALLLTLCLLAGMMPAAVFAAAAYKYSNAALRGGADSHVYAATISYQSGRFSYNIQYVYSPDIPMNPEWLQEVKETFAASENSKVYRSMIPAGDEDQEKPGFFILDGPAGCEEILEDKKVDLTEPIEVARALFPAMDNSVTPQEDLSIVTDISQLHQSDTVTDQNGETAALSEGQNRMEFVVEEAGGAKEMHVTQLSAQTIETNVKAEYKQEHVYNVYRQAVIDGGADANLYAVSIPDAEGGALFYVYSPDIPHDDDLFAEVKRGLNEPYKALIPILKEDYSSEKGLLAFSRDQEKYEAMDLNWADYRSVAEALAPERGHALSGENNDALANKDIAETIQNPVSVDDPSVPPQSTNWKGVDKSAHRVGASYAISFEDELIVEDGNTERKVYIYHHCYAVNLIPRIVNVYPIAEESTEGYFYSDDALKGGADSSVYAVTIKGVDGGDLHYVYSPEVVVNPELIGKIKKSLAEPYQSLIPSAGAAVWGADTGADTLESREILFFSRNQSKYKAMNLDWADPKAVAEALVPGSENVTCSETRNAISVEDSLTMEKEDAPIYQWDDFDWDSYDPQFDLSALDEATPAPGKNRVERLLKGVMALSSNPVSFTECYQKMYVTQLFAYTAQRGKSQSSHTSHSGSSSGSSASPLPLAPGASYQPPEPGEPAQPGESGEPAQSGGNPGSFKSDTTSDLTVGGAYQFRITSLDGTVPVMTVENESFRVEFASQEGNDYFFRIVPQGAAGSTAVISVNGASLLTATVGGSVSAVVSDTTHPFTVAQGGAYQFRLTASARPDFAAGSPSFTVEYAGRIGSDYFYKVRAVGQPGDGCGFYVNGEASPVAVATIA